MLGVLSAVTIAVSLGFSFIETDVIFGVKTPLILVFIFGATTMPLYSICAIHANNLISPPQMAALSASLIFTFAIGAIISPVIASFLIDHFGPDSLFIYFAVLHGILMGYTGYRSIRRPDIANISKYFYIPRTSLFIARTIKSVKYSSSRKKGVSAQMQKNDKNNSTWINASGRFCVGTTFIAQTTGMETIGPMTFTAIRYLIGALTVLPLAIFEARRVSLWAHMKADRRFALQTIGLGFLMFGGIGLQQTALQYTDVANAAFLTVVCACGATYHVAVHAQPDR